MAALTDFSLRVLTETFARWGHPPSHARRLLRAFYDGAGRVDLDALQLGRALTRRLVDDVPLRQSTVVRRHVSVDGSIKLLVGFAGGGAVESVLMPGFRPDRAAGCVSSQIGCAMACGFCASARGGLGRDLTSGEIVEQFLHLREAAVESGRRLSSLVFMGMGEPLANYANVVAAIRLIAGPETGSLGGRQITVSTVGLAPRIDALADEHLNVHLALSLHAPDDETRSAIVPANRKWNVQTVIAAARRFEAVTGRIPTVEYCMLAGVNDSDEQADLLARLLAGFRAHLNLIPHNPIGAGVGGICYAPSSVERIARFVAILRGAGVVTNVRVRRGDDVAAACGQLARR